MTAFFEPKHNNASYAIFYQMSQPKLSIGQSYLNPPSFIRRQARAELLEI